MLLSIAAALASGLDGMSVVEANALKEQRLELEIQQMMSEDARLVCPDGCIEKPGSFHPPIRSTLSGDTVILEGFVPPHVHAQFTTGGWTLRMRQVRLDACDSEDFFSMPLPSDALIPLSFVGFPDRFVRLTLDLPEAWELDYQNTSWTFALVKDGDTVSMGAIETSTPTVWPHCPPSAQTLEMWDAVERAREAVITGGASPRHR